MAEGSIAQTTKRIAFGLMIFYGICLIITLVASIYFFKEQNGDKWISTFKDGFAFLGGALATIIGYYFGNKNVGEAEERASSALEKAKQEETKTQVLKKEVIDTAVKNDPVSAETSPIANESALVLPDEEQQ